MEHYETDLNGEANVARKLCDGRPGVRTMASRAIPEHTQAFAGHVTKHVDINVDLKVCQAVGEESVLGPRQDRLAVIFCDKAG